MPRLPVATILLAMLALLLPATLGCADEPSLSNSGDLLAQADAPGEAEKAKPETGETAEKDAAVENPFPNRVQIPKGIFEGGKGWLNTSGEIKLEDLRGKIVILDFWTYCCINCMHILPDLKYLEQKYPNQLVVIGVHSAKFENEQDSEAIRQAIIRYEIEHPVINDADMTLWRRFGTSGWPTLTLIDPEGYYLGSQSGEGTRDLFDHLVERLVKYHRAKGTLDESPVRFNLEREKLAPTPLRYPGKVLADEAHNRLFISDSNHNRIVITTLDGELVDVIGSGALGRADGTYAEATFDHPQGMALVGETLYVADTENHLLRAVDLTAKTMSTFAGLGTQDQSRSTGGKLRETALNSPWDLCVLDGTLYVAMAGPHQIWSHVLGSDTIGVFAGTGREDIRNGPLDESALAQPSGMATDGKFLYVCDSEGSAIRKIGPPGAGGKVETIAGESDLPGGRTLFEFGDKDGVGKEARLQHPLGIAYADGTLYVADSYNHKIKRINLESGETTSWLGTGKAGDQLDPPQFSEPAGLAIAGGRLFIADTNNQRIQVADLASGKVSTLTIPALEPPPAPEPVDVTIGDTPVVKLEEQSVALADGAVKFRVSFKLPEGYKLNTLAPVTFKVESDPPGALVAPDHIGKRKAAELDGDAAVVTLPTAAPNGKSTITLSLSYGYCRDGVGGLCKMGTTRWEIPLNVAGDAPAKPINLTAQPKE